jgi:hypothetical protein
MVDLQQLEARLGGKRSLIVRVLEAFLSDTASFNTPSVVWDSKNLHKLKGITREICDLKTSELAAKLESVAAQNMFPVPAEIQALTQSLEETMAEVRILIKELKGATN